MDDAQYIREMFTYDPNTGELVHAVGRLVGKPIGRYDRDGYLRASFRNKTQRVHRLVWLYVYGVWPEIIDHINHNKADNRVINLRSVSRLENQRNRSLSANNKSGVNGVYWAPRDKRWIAHIKIRGVNTYLGCFKSFDDAVLARQEAESANGFHELHGRAA